MNSMIRTVPFSALTRQFDEMFGDLMSPPAASLAEVSRLLPPVNVREDEKNFYVEAEVPGFTQDQIDVSIHQNVLTIKGERAEQKEEQDENFIRRERSTGSFTRSFRLVSDIDAGKINASLKNGVLHVTLPKAAAAQTRKIAVTGN